MHPLVKGGLGCAAAASVVAVYVAYVRYFKPETPKNFTPPNGALKHNSPRKPDTDPSRDAFREKKLPDEIDYIIVGTGMGSLYCAGLLAKAGKKCVLIEQHYVAGGCTHSFHDGGFEFDTGLHYVGRMEKYKALLDLVSTGTQVEWAKMGNEEDGYCYDEIKLGADKPWKFRAGEETFINDLVVEFPDEEAGIKEYIRLCKKVNKLADLYFYGKIFDREIQKLMNRFVNTEYFKYAKMTTACVVNSLIENKRLRAILCGQFGDYGLTPDNSSFLIQAGITAHYLGGAYYPIGGSGEISKAIIPTIEAAGGRVFVCCRAKGIAIEGGRAVGVDVVAVDKAGQDKGDIVALRAKLGVISGAGAVATEKLVPPTVRSLLGFETMLKEVQPSISHVYGFIGMKGTTEELGLRAANLWVLPVDDEYNYTGPAIDKTDKNSAASNPWDGLGNAGTTKEDMLLFIGFPSVKDPSFNDRFPGKSACEIITTAHPDWFQQYDTSDKPQSGKRNNKDYTDLKKSLEEKLLNGLYRNYPKTKGKVEYVNIGTPLTNSYYLGRTDSYGLEHTPNHYAGSLDKMRPQTRIPGFYTTGQDIGTVGIVGALNGGILTAHAVLGYSLWDLLVEDRNLIEDLMRMDKKAK